MKGKGIILISLIVLFLPLFLSTIHEQNAGSELKISAPLKNNHSPVSHFSGRIQTLAIDEIDKTTGKLKCRFVHYLNTEDGKRYQIEDKKGILRGVKSSWKMNIRGNLVENKVVVEDAKPLDMPAESEQLQDTIGEQRTLVALLNSSDDLSQPFTVEDVEDEIINNPNSTDKSFRESSYEKVWLNADFIDWQTLPHNSTDYSNNLFSLSDDTIDTLDPIVNFQDYERLIFIYTDTTVEEGICGSGSIGKETLRSSGDGDFTASVAMVWCMNDGLILHELGHNFGFWHASSVVSAGPYFIPESLLDLLTSSSAIYEEYDDLGDVMGSGLSSEAEEAEDGRYFSFSTIWKSQAQWIDATQIQEADASGEYIIDQVAISSTGIKALKIPMGKDANGEDFYYWLEYRKNLGSSDRTNEVNIVQLRTKLTNAYVGYWTNNSIRFKYDLDFGSSQQFTDIDINKLFRDPYRGVNIKLIEKTGSGAESKAKLGVALSGLNTDPKNILDFGDVIVNSKSSKVITVTNNSGGDIEFGSVSLDGRNPEHFSIVKDECSNKTISNGESSNITISFTPASEGDKFGILSVPNNDPIRSKATISLYGYGSTEITSTPTPTVTPTPSPTQKPTVAPTPISCDDSYEPNDSKETAYGLLTSGSSYEGKICSNSDVDWYKVNITSAGTISLSLTCPSSNDFDMELYDSSDTLIASSNRGADADESIRYDVTTTGDYYIKVYEFYGSYNSTTPYTLTYSFVNTVSSPSPVTTPTPSPSPSSTPLSCTDTYESNDSFGTAYGPLYPQSSYQGKICSPVDVDYFKITVTGPGIISITQSVPLGKDYDLFLYDASQSLVAFSGLGTGGAETITYFANTAGTYYIQVVGYAGSYDENQVYTLSYIWQPMATATPTTPDCGVKSIRVIPGKLKIQKDKSKDITVTVTGTDDCPVEGTTVTATIKVGKNRISISPISQSTDEDGKATFKVTAGNTSGRARIMFVAGDKEKILLVKIK